MKMTLIARQIPMQLNLALENDAEDFAVLLNLLDVSNWLKAFSVSLRKVFFNTVVTFQQQKISQNGFNLSIEEITGSLHLHSTLKHLKFYTRCPTYQQKLLQRVQVRHVNKIIKLIDAVHVFCVIVYT